MRASAADQGYGHDVAVYARKQSLNPPTERRILLGKTREGRARPVDQQHAQVGDSPIRQNEISLAVSQSRTKNAPAESGTGLQPARKSFWPTGGQIRWAAMGLMIGHYSDNSDAAFARR